MLPRTGVTSRGNISAGQKTGRMSGMGYVVMRCAVLLLLAVASRSEAATCLEAERTVSGCLSDGPVLLQCPINYMVSIYSATLRRLVSGTCTAAAVASAGVSGSCEVSDVTTLNRQLCTTQQMCTVTGSSVANAACDATHSGEYFIHVNFYCIETMGVSNPNTVPLYMCDDSGWNASLIHANSFSGIDLTAIGETTCSCRVSAPAATRVVARLLFWIGPNDCAQRVVITDGYTTWDFCGSTKYQQLGCGSGPTDYYISYVTDDPSKTVLFAVEMFVHPSALLSLKCSPNLMTPPPTTPAPDTTTTELTTTQTTTTAPTTTEMTTAPPTTTAEMTTAPPTTTAEMTTAPPTTITTAPPTTTTEITTAPPTTTAEITTAPPTTTAEMTTAPPTTTASMTTAPPTTTTQAPTSVTTTAPLTTSTKPLTTAITQPVTTEADRANDVTTTTSSALSSSNTSDKVPIIIGAVFAAVLLLLIIAVIIIIRWRKAQYDADNARAGRHTGADDHMTYVTNVYTDGTYDSKLVVGNTMPHFR